MKIRTPLNIELLLHIHCRADRLEHLNAPAVVESIKVFLEAGVIKVDPDKEKGFYKTTDKGKAWVEALCNVEEPKAVWVDSLEEVKDEAKEADYPNWAPPDKNFESALKRIVKEVVAELNFLKEEEVVLPSPKEVMLKPMSKMSELDKFILFYDPYKIPFEDQTRELSEVFRDRLKLVIAEVRRKS